MSSHEKNKILVIRLSSFGDVLLTTCVLRVLKQHNPKIFIGYVIKRAFKPMIQNNPYIDQIFEYESKTLLLDLRKNEFDHIIDLQSNQRSWKLCKSLNRPTSKYKKDRIKRFLFMKFGYKKFNDPIKSVPQKYLDVLNSLGIYSTDTQPEYYLNGTKNIIEAKDYICIAPGAAHFTKQWPKEHYVELIMSLKGTNEIILLGGPAEKETADWIQQETGIKNNFVGKTTFEESAKLINNSKLVICNDSSLMHLATALKKPVLTFFGSTVEEFGFFPYNTRHKVLEDKNLDCRPCTHVGRSSCPKEHFKCMKIILPKNAFVEANKLLEC